MQLRRIEAHSLFLTPLGYQRQWYRYHALYREFLLGELRRTEPGIIMALHQRAADWYESNGFPALALEHLLHTDDSDRAVRLTAELALPTYMAGQLSTVQRWYGVLGDANIARYPPLAVLAGWEGVLTGDAAKAERWAAVVDAASFAGEPASGAASFDSARALLRAAMCPNGPEQMMADAAFSLAQEPAWSPWRDTALWLLAEAHLLAGQPGEARALFAEASTIAAGMSNWDTIPICETQLAWLAMDRGEWAEAADRLTLALGTIDAQRLHDYVFSLPAFAVAARLSLHRGDPQEARRQLAPAMRARPSATYLLPYHSVRLRLQLARVYLALAEPATARQLLREIDDIVSRRPSGPWLMRSRISATSWRPEPPRRRPAHCRSPRPSYACFPICKPTSPPTRSQSGCSSPATRSRPRSRRSTASWVSRPGTTRCNERRRSACSAASRRHRRDRLIVQYPYQGDAEAAFASPR